MAIRHKRKGTTGYTWQSSDLVSGQIGVNTADGTLHVKKDNDALVTIEGKTPKIATPSFSTTMSISVSGLVDIVRVTFTDNATVDFTGGTDGQRFIFEVKQDTTGSRTLSFGSSVRFGTDITGVTLTTTANKTDRIGFIYNSAASKYDVVAVVKGY